MAHDLPQQVRMLLTRFLALVEIKRSAQLTLCRCRNVTRGSERNTELELILVASVAAEAASKRVRRVASVARAMTSGIDSRPSSGGECCKGRLTMRFSGCPNGRASRGARGERANRS